MNGAGMLIFGMICFVLGALIWEIIMRHLPPK
jgi:hypothetical protein